MRNFSTLFTDNTGGFLGKINPEKNQLIEINNAKIIIMNWLRQGISNSIEEREGIRIFPRFMSQGSSVYKTRNKPYFVPPQQIDHDFGCYLPLTIIKETGTPKIAARSFFEIVDALLHQLAKKEHWIGVDINKKTCSRVIMNQEIHIDIPLYSIPDDEFETIREKIEKSSVFSSEDARMRLDNWKTVQVKNVLLAHREQGWKVSDPRKLNEYFRKIFMLKGEQLRRISRYLKAWRDYNWKKGGPTSLYLMLSADDVFELQDRDDLAFLDVLSKMYKNLKNDSYRLENPTDANEIIEIDGIDRTILKELTGLFSKDLRAAIYDLDIPDIESCKKIRRHLGDRFPLADHIPKESSTNREIVLNTPISNIEMRTPNNRGRAG
jgi:hypothetical protein